MRTFAVVALLAAVGFGWLADLPSARAEKDEVKDKKDEVKDKDGPTPKDAKDKPADKDAKDPKDPKDKPETKEEAFDQDKADQETLKSAGVAADAGSILKFFKQHTITDADRATIAGLIKKFGSDSFDEREEATDEIKSFGPGARPPPPGGKGQGLRDRPPL